ncbi:hypothetical protein VMCG_08892 [Cytospora schulzeri]|uniref:Uncharacterized protein n=1 Tax=Cytospora schulzeri TaxID=448051 RepID=A0A423VUM5_9PEZI|nr:hypothetical protein VMCG_08892 [Valsa malicola]
MPIFKARPEQPGSHSRSSSVPPIHLHSLGLAHTLSPATCLPSLAEQYTPTKPSKRNVFSWSRLPHHIQQGILAHALLPDGPGTPISIGLPEHRAHLNATAVPIFLALGSWEAYGNAAAIFYHHIYINLSLFQGSAMTFLTSPTTLRPRSLVVQVQLHFTIKEHIVLFDTGYTVSQSMGKLIKMNIPTSLRSMQTHGRLSEVELLILRGQQVDPESGRESAAPGYYFPMARIQLAGWTPVAGSDDLLQPAEAIVAPAFLACRAFQSGLLPLLEDGVFEKTRLALQSVGDMDGATTVHEVDRNTFVQYWLGATVLELLDIFSTVETWADPFPTTVRCGGNADEMALDLTLSPGSDTVAPSREIKYELLSSPVKFPTSSSGSDTESSSDEVVIKFDTLRDDPRQEKQDASRNESGLSDDDVDDTSSEGSSSSEEFVRELHKRFGAIPLEDGLDSPKDEDSSSSSDDSDELDDSSPSPAAMHPEIARAELISTLTTAVASDDTMEAIARATADRQVTSFGVSKGPCTHADTVPNCSACQNMSEDSSESSEGDDDIPRMPACKTPTAIPRTSSTDLDGTTSQHLLTCDSTRARFLGGDDEADSDTDTDTDTDTDISSSTEGQRDEREHEVSTADLSHMEKIFGARAEDKTTVDVHGGIVPTNCILARMSSASERADRQSNDDKMAGRAESIDLGLDKDDESQLWVDGQASKDVSAEPTGQAEAKAQAGTKSDQTNSPQMTTPTTPALHSSCLKTLAPLSARSKPSFKSKGTQTKRVPNKPAKANHPQGKQAKPAAAANSRVSKKRKAPLADEGPRPSRASRRKRARSRKEKHLRLAKRIEAEAAEREKTLVN